MIQKENNPRSPKEIIEQMTQKIAVDYQFYHRAIDMFGHAKAGSLFTSKELEVFGRIDRHPEVQHVFHGIYLEVQSLGEADAAQPRIWADGSISTTSVHERQVLAERFKEELSVVTSGVLGAWALVKGRELFPDSPDQQAAFGKMWATVGELWFAAAEMAHGQHEYEHFLPEPPGMQLHSPDNADQIVISDKPVGHDLPGIPGQDESNSERSHAAPAEQQHLQIVDHNPEQVSEDSNLPDVDDPYTPDHAPGENNFTHGQHGPIHVDYDLPSAHHGVDHTSGDGHEQSLDPSYDHSQTHDLGNTPDHAPGENNFTHGQHGPIHVDYDLPSAHHGVDHTSGDGHEQSLDPSYDHSQTAPDLGLTPDDANMTEEHGHSVNANHDPSQEAQEVAYAPADTGTVAMQSIQTDDASGASTGDFAASAASLSSGGE